MIANYRYTYFRIDLGDAAQMGGALTVDTCTSSFDSIVFVGLGMPWISSQFRCMGGNDDNAAMCPTTKTASSVTISGMNQTFAWVLVTVYGNAAPPTTAR